MSVTATETTTAEPAQEPAPAPSEQAAPEASEGDRLLDQIIATHGSEPSGIASGVRAHAAQQGEIMAAVQKRFGNKFAQEVEEALNPTQTAGPAPEAAPADTPPPAE